MKTTYLKGSKRLAVIHRWLNGIDDPNYEVLPTRKEGKYIVKKRVSERVRSTPESSYEGLHSNPATTSYELDSKPEVTTTEDTVQPDVEEHNTTEPDDNDISNNEQEEQEQPPSKQPPVKQAPSKHTPSKQPPIKPAPIKQPPTKQPRSKPTSTMHYDPTVNLEILEQLKLLGDEIRSKRERREQKQLINHVLDKRMRKQQPHKLIPQSQPIEEYEYYSEDSEPVQQPIQQQPIVFKSRIRR